MKVFLVNDGAWYEFRFEETRVFSTVEKAKEYIVKQEYPDAWSMVEVIIDNEKGGEFVKLLIENAS